MSVPARPRSAGNSSILSIRTPSSAATRAANASAAARPSADGGGSSTRSAPRSSSRPAKSHPDVPLRRLTTSGSCMRWSTRAPMMLRVRPAQLTTTVAFGRSRRRSWIRRASSPPGTLRPPGMQNRWYSSGVRVSTNDQVVAARSGDGPAHRRRWSVRGAAPRPSHQNPCWGRSCPTRWADSG